MKIKDKESECFRYIRMNIEDVYQGREEGRRYIAGMFDLAVRFNLVTNEELSELTAMSDEKRKRDMSCR